MKEEVSKIRVMDCMCIDVIESKKLKIEVDKFGFNYCFNPANELYLSEIKVCLLIVCSIH